MGRDTEAADTTMYTSSSPTLSLDVPEDEGEDEDEGKANQVEEYGSEAATKDGGIFVHGQVLSAGLLGFAMGQR